jgi:predicted transcriptional regulator
MKQSDEISVSRRERQILDILYERGRSTAAEVHERLPDAPSYSSVRTLLRILEEKGHVRHEQEGPRYVFIPKVPRDRAKQSALKRLISTFFDGSAEQAAAALLDGSVTKLGEAELDRLAKLIEDARRDGR